MAIALAPCLFGLPGVAALALAAAVPALASTPPSKENPTMASPAPPRPSRPSAPEVAPVTLAGVRYLQDREAWRRAGEPPGGYLQAVDAATGRPLWRPKVYAVAAPAPGAPTGGGGPYFQSQHVVQDGAALEVVNQSGGHYRIDLATRLVQQVGGPPETAAPTASPPAPPKPSLKPDAKPQLKP